MLRRALLCSLVFAAVQSACGGGPDPGPGREPKDSGFLPRYRLDAGEDADGAPADLDDAGPPGAEIEDGDGGAKPADGDAGAQLPGPVDAEASDAEPAPDA